MEGLASKLFPGSVSAPELAQRLVREADLSLTESAAGPVVPNVYGVRLHPDDLGGDAGPLTGELAAVIADHATQSGWRLEGAVTVSVVADPAMRAGAIDVASDVVKGSLPRWAYLVSKGQDAEHDLIHNRALVGRGTDSDVRIDADTVSRNHAVLWREGPDVWVADLGSSNGTKVNGAAIRAPVLVANGDTLAFGPFECTFRTM